MIVSGSWGDNDSFADLTLDSCEHQGYSTQFEFSICLRLLLLQYFLNANMNINFVSGYMLKIPRNIPPLSHNTINFNLVTPVKVRRWGGVLGEVAGCLGLDCCKYNWILIFSLQSTVHRQHQLAITNLRFD